MKPSFKFISIILLCFLGLLVGIVTDSQEVLLESQESKTPSGGPVFNKIKWFQLKDKDVWMMNQSHHGSFVDERSWERLAIVIDKTKSPKVARFLQLEPGPLEWTENLNERPFKVSCFICHNNGPRVIRPNYESPLGPTSLANRIKISYWNLKIKFYGRIVADPTHDEKDQRFHPPFRFRSKYENDALKIATCTKCHKDAGWLARGTLRRQQIPTIKFMLEAGQMPPIGHQMTEKEKYELELFMMGF